MSKKTTKQAGFTLVEISLAMAIFTFMLLVVSLAYINIARLYNASTAARNVQQNNRFAMEQMTRVARASKTASTSLPTSDGGITCLQLNSKAGSQVFYLHSLDASDAKKNELRQAVGTCGPVSTTATDYTVLSSPGMYAARMEASVDQGTITMRLWMSSKTDLLNNSGGLQCSSSTRLEFCAINKLITTVELRGE